MAEEYRSRSYLAFAQAQIRCGTALLRAGRQAFVAGKTPLLLTHRIRHEKALFHSTIEYTT